MTTVKLAELATHPILSDGHYLCAGCMLLEVPR